MRQKLAIICNFLRLKILIIIPHFSFLIKIVLVTSKPWHIWCFKNLQIIPVIAITYLTILFHPEAIICSFLFLKFFFVWILLSIGFSLPQALYLDARDQVFFYYGWLYRFIYGNGCCVGSIFGFLYCIYKVNTWTLKITFFL